MNTTKTTTLCRDKSLKLKIKIFRDSFRDKVSRKREEVFMVPITIGLSLRGCESGEAEYIRPMADFGLCSAHLTII